MKRTKLLVSAILAGIMLLLFVPISFAEEAEQPELSLQQAVDRALELSKSLKSAELEKDKAKELRKDAQKDVKYTPIGMVSPEIQTAYSLLLKAELNYQIKSKDLDSLKDDIKAEVVEKYCNVLSAQSAYLAAENALENAQWQYNAALGQLHVGMLAPASRAAVEAALEGAKAGVAAAQEHLNKAYVELNALVGFMPDKRPKLTTDIPYEELKVDSITADVNRAIANNTDVWKALQAVILERQDLRMEKNPLLGIDTYEVEKLEVEIAELTASEAKDILEEKLTLVYHDILTLQESIAASEKAVVAAEQAVNTAKLKFEVGMATQGDVVSAQAELESVKNSLAELKYRHAAALSAYRNITGRDPLPVIDKKEEVNQREVVH